jgi:hypothetical protein
MPSPFASRAPTAAPATALRMWSTPTAIFAEIPAARGGQPYVIRFERSDAGLSKALALLARHTERADPPLLTRPKHINAQCAAVLRSMGIIE